MTLFFQLRAKLRAGLPLLSESTTRGFASWLAFLAGLPGLVGLVVVSAALWISFGHVPDISNRQHLGAWGVLLAFLVMCFGVLFHELMHIAAFFSRGGTRASVLVRLRFGVLPALTARMMTQRDQLSWDSLALISVAGPIGAGALALAINSLAGNLDWLYWGCVGTVVSSLFNLLPIKGFDGHHFLDALRARFSK